MGGIILVVLHIYGARAIFLLFCDHQETESETREMNIGAAGPMFTKKRSNALCDNNIHTLHDG